MKHLTLEQRYEIALLKREKYSVAAIVVTTGISKSVIYREIKRNSDKRSGVYKADLAQRKTNERHADKPKHMRFTPAVRLLVTENLKKDFSPEQIVGLAKKDSVYCVSIERIYQFIWTDKKKGGELYLHLRTQGKRYRKRGSTKDKRGQIVGRIDIDFRPAIVDEKIRVGDLEIDLVIGEGHKKALLTINDRVTGILKMKKIDSKEALGVEIAVLELLKDWKSIIHTITSDNGKEFANHQSIAEKLDIDYFFAHPYCSWERGANENLNGLVRQYFPKKTSFEFITDDEVILVVNKLNNRPRKRFGFKTPNEIFSQFEAKALVAFIT
jgi:IS30 family transposase